MLGKKYTAEYKIEKVKEYLSKIENGEMNPSFLILKAIIQVLHNSLDSLIISDGSADEGAEQMKMLYLSCPPEMQETLLNNTKRLTEELISLSKKLEKE